MALSPSSSETGPVIEPEQRNLLSSITPVEKGDGHWMMGIEFAPEGLLGVSIADISDTAVTKSTPASAEALSVYTPFLIELAVERPLPWPIEAVEAVAMRAFMQTRSALIEDAMATGSVSGSQFLGDTDATVYGAGAAVPDVAMARIYESACMLGGEMTFYMNPGVAGILGERGYFRESDGKLYTLRGDLVVLGNYGNVGPGPTSTGADQSYIFAHLGPPQLCLGDVHVFTAIDQTDNTRVTRVEQAVAVTWQPGQFVTLAKYA